MQVVLCRAFPTSEIHASGQMHYSGGQVNHCIHLQRGRKHQHLFGTTHLSCPRTTSKQNPSIFLPFVAAYKAVSAFAGMVHCEGSYHQYGLKPVSPKVVSASRQAAGREAARRHSPSNRNSGKSAIPHMANLSMTQYFKYI